MEIDDEYENIYLLGIYIKYLRLDLKLALEQIEKTFAKK
jgi:hypothetical protein